MPTNVRTDNRNWVSEFCGATVIQPDDPVKLKDKGKPGTALHANNSTALNNPAGTVFDHGTHVAHNESFMAKGQHAPVVISGINTAQLNGDTGFLSYMKTVFIEGRNVVNHDVQAKVNAAWSALPAPVKRLVQGVNAVIEKFKALGNTGGADGAQTLGEALGFAKQAVSVAQQVAVLVSSKAPTAGRLLAGVGLLNGLGGRADEADGPAEGPAASLLPMAAHWAMPMSPAQAAQGADELAAFTKSLAVASEVRQPRGVL